MTGRFDTMVQETMALYGGYAFLSTLMVATTAHAVWYTWTH